MFFYVHASDIRSMICLVDFSMELAQFRIRSSSPLHDVAESWRHVLWMSGVLVHHLVWEAVMCGEALALMVDLHQTFSDLQIRLFVRVLVRKGISVLLLHDMKVEVDCPSMHPLGDLVWVSGSGRRYSRSIRRTS